MARQMEMRVPAAKLKTSVPSQCSAITTLRVGQRRARRRSVMTAGRAPKSHLGAQLVRVAPGAADARLAGAQVAPSEREFQRARQLEREAASGGRPAGWLAG